MRLPEWTTNDPADECRCERCAAPRLLQIRRMRVMYVVYYMEGLVSYRYGTADTEAEARDMAEGARREGKHGVTYTYERQRADLQ